MGKVVVLECTHCQFKEEILIGNVEEKKEINLDEIVMSIKAKEHIKGLLKEGYQISDFSTNIYLCEGCMTVYQRASLKLKNMNGKLEFELNHNCPKCRKELEAIKSENILGYMCPSCSSMSLIKRAEYNLE